MTKYFTILVIAFIFISYFPKPAQTLKADEIKPCVNYSSFKYIACQKAFKYGIDKSLFLAQIEQESGFNPVKKSRSGALGIAQIMPKTAKSWKVNPFNPVSALDKAAEAMASYVRTYKNQGHSKIDSYKLALAAYNAGTGSVRKYKGIPPYPETQKYIKNIFHLSKKYL